MACFSAPLAEALAIAATTSKNSEKSGNPFVRRVGWLKKMLFGGSALLAIEHAWHGEITWRFPFLTAVRDGDVAGMLSEIATVGVAMAVVITVAWAALVCAVDYAESRRRIQENA